eukprot:4947257-Amphidinium_carterae.1
MLLWRGLCALLGRLQCPPPDARRVARHVRLTNLILHVLHTATGSRTGLNRPTLQRKPIKVPHIKSSGTGMLHIHKDQFY